jgi:hypothetical protein
MEIMKILLSPQRNNKQLNYEFENERIRVTYDGLTDTFDFSTLPNGKAETINTLLPINPIVSAKRENGVLSVELIQFISSDATDEERYPRWQEV